MAQNMPKPLSDEEVGRQFKNWIDTQVIVDLVIEKMKEEEVEVTFENCQKVWLDILMTELPDAVGSTIKYQFYDGKLPEER